MEKQAAFSLQRATSFLLRISRELFGHVMAPLRSGKNTLMKMIDLFSGELFDPNFKNRVSSVNRVYMNLRHQE